MAVCMSAAIGHEHDAECDAKVSNGHVDGRLPAPRRRDGHRAALLCRFVAVNILSVRASSPSENTPSFAM